LLTRYSKFLAYTANGKDSISFVVVHDKKANIAVKSHEREFSHAIIVYNAHVFVCERPEAKDIVD
jgi:hypothetical protein